MAEKMPSYKTLSESDRKHTILRKAEYPDRNLPEAKVKREESPTASSPQRLIFSRRRAFIPAAVPSFTLPKLTQCKTSCPKVCETKKLDEKPNAADE